MMRGAPGMPRGEDRCRSARAHLHGARLELIRLIFLKTGLVLAEYSYLNPYETGGMDCSDEAGVQALNADLKVYFCVSRFFLFYWV